MHLLGSERDEILKKAAGQAMMCVRKRIRGGAATNQIVSKNEALSQSGRIFEPLVGHSVQDMVDLVDPVSPQDVGQGVQAVQEKLRAQRLESLPSDLPETLETSLEAATRGGMLGCKLCYVDKFIVIGCRLF